LSLNRSEKEAVISDVTGLAAKAQTLVIAEYRGITVADMTKLRNTARSNGVSLSVLKNTLARRAVAGSAFEVVSDQMTGPLIYGFSEDAVAAAKVVAEFAKTNDKLVIRAGAYGGKALDVNGVKQLASIPSKGSAVGAVVGLDAVPHFPYGPRAVGFGGEKRRGCSRRSSCRVNAAACRNQTC
jgi:large subunit ribosomal protein L10